MTTLGIIAGGGDLPVAIGECARDAGRDVFVAALQGIADESLAQFRHEWVSVGQTGRTLSLLRQHGCRDVLLAGRVARPNWADIKFDATAVMKLPKVMAAALRGDDALLRSFVDILQSEGFRVVSVLEAAPALVAPAGVLGRRRPSALDQADVARGVGIVRALGTLDVGQSAVVSSGLALAVEAAEGTDAMIARISSLPENIRGSAAARRGVLVKAKKPTQDGRTDLPVIGVSTVDNVVAAGLAGIAVEAGASLIVRKSAVIERADAAGLFLLGFAPPG